MANKIDHETMNISAGLHLVVAQNSNFRASIFIPSSVDGVTEAQLAGLAKNVIRVDVAD